MPKAAYPVGSDLQSYFSQAGLIVNGLDFDNAVLAGIARFEQETGRRFLAASDTTHTFDLPQHGRTVLNLKGDLASVTTVTVSGASQTLGTDYRMLPSDAAPKGLPWDRIEFAVRYYAMQLPAAWGAIAVTGRWAYGTTIPDDAWAAMLQGAALERHPQLATLQAGGLISWHEADVSEEYGAKPFGYLLDAWNQLYQAAVARHRRVTVGF